MADGKANQKGNPSLRVNRAEVYAPMPKKAAWPREAWPAYPDIMFRDKVSII
jgi:hypothetical protein